MKNKTGRLWGSKAYCVGPMDRISLQDATEWRDDICDFLYSIGVIPLNPCNKKILGFNEEAEDRKHINCLLDKEKYDELSKLGRDNVRRPDLRFTDGSDFLIVNLSLKDHPCGSYEELFTSNKQKHPILVRLKEGKRNAPLWLFYTIPHQFIFNTFEEIKEYLLYVNDWNNNPETYGRWIFINYFELMKPIIDQLLVVESSSNSNS